MNLFYQPLIDQGIHHLDEEESRHCIKVLRKHEGDPINITDGKGFFYEGIIKKADSSQCSFNIVGKTPERKKQFSIHIAISPTKNADRTEWFVEKAVEIGIDQITLLECKNTERAYLKTERLRKVAVSAMKQSIKATLPVINEVTEFNSILRDAADQKFIAFVDPANPFHLYKAAKPKQSYLILIGPEGDFTVDELEAAIAVGFIKVSLSDSRLRTETAGITACQMLNLANISA